MNVAELKLKLDEQGIHPGEYSLNGEKHPDALILEERGLIGEWVVYIWERNKEVDLKIFITEDFACKYIYDYYVSLYSHMPEELRARYKALFRK